MSEDNISNVGNVETMCSICGDRLDNAFIHKTECDHIFHYECLQKSFINSFEKNNSCPLCRQSIHLLPIVNGLKKLIRDIHYTSEEYIIDLNYINIPCNHIKKTGKNKGQVCNKNCKVGYNVCGKHIKK